MKAFIRVKPNNSGMKGQLSFDLITAILIATLFLQTMMVMSDSMEKTSEHLAIESQLFYIGEDIASMLDLAPLLRPNMYYFHEVPWIYSGESKYPCSILVEPDQNKITVTFTQIENAEIVRQVSKSVVFANSEDFTTADDFSALRCGRNIRIMRGVDYNVSFTQA